MSLMNNKLKKIIDLYYKYYLINIYNLIHTYQCNWYFEEIPKEHCKYVNNTHLKHDHFQSANSFLNKYREEKMLLGEDLIKNGSFFPFFSHKNQRENTIDIILGKHRVYSLMLYYNFHSEEIKKQFLIIELPEKTSNIYHSKINKDVFYAFREDLNPILVPQQLHSRFHLLVHLFDAIGGKLSNLLFNSNLSPSEILNNENLFTQFINEPLDENNILFKYIPELH